MMTTDHCIISLSGQCGLQVDECCGMANEGCCVGGQECYTYYETVCDQSVTQRCRPKFKQVCVQETLPYCTVQKKRGSVVSCEKVFSFSIFKYFSYFSKM